MNDQGKTLSEITATNAIKYYERERLSAAQVYDMKVAQALAEYNRTVREASTKYFDAVTRATQENIIAEDEEQGNGSTS